MKRLLLLVLLFSFVQFLFAQTNTFPSSGNVGIGTNIPNAKITFNNLDDGANQPDGISWYNPAPLAYGIYRTPGSWVTPNYQQLKIGFETGIVLNPGTAYGKSFVEVQGGGLRVSSGNVGIGTTSPSFKFQIRGGNPNSNLMTLGSSTTGNFALTSADGGAYGLFGGVSDTGRAWLQAGRYDTNMAYDLLLQASGGNVGIGTATPAAPIEVYLSSALPTALGSKQLLTRIASGGANYYQNNLWIFRDDNSNITDWWNVRMHDAISIGGAYQTPGTDTRTWWERDPLENIQSWGNANQTYMTINQGNVGIGTTDPKGYKLAIAGKAVAEEVVVKLQVNWPDYVFEYDYKLPSLSELEQFIKTNKHLPGVPTAKDVKENGLSLGEMNAILLKKVEELTLYLLEQNKTLKTQQEQINNLKEQNKLLQSQIMKKQ